MKKLLAILLAATMCVTLLAACGGQSNDTTTDGDTATTDTNDTKTDANADMIYAVETGSAGEAAAKEKGWEINSVAAQADALMEVEAGTSDAAIVDLLMATAMTGEGTSYPDLTYDAEQKLTTEEYGIGCRKGSDLAAFINNVLAETDMAKLVAEKLGVDIEFTVINWDNKIMELDSKSIDVVWNGMTLTDEVKNSMECTNPYFNNAQVVVTKAAE